MKIKLKILFPLMSFLLCVVSMISHVFAGNGRIVILKPPCKMSDLRGGIKLCDSKESALHRIVKHGSLEGLRIFLEETDMSDIQYDAEPTLVATPYPVENPLVNSVDAYGSPPLHYAAMEGKMGMVKMLIENGAMVDTQDCFGNTALHYAVYGNRFKTVLVLCESHANVNLENFSGKKPVDFADLENAQMINMLRAYERSRV